jgi:hypothetical protein
MYQRGTYIDALRVIESQLRSISKRRSRVQLEFVPIVKSDRPAGQPA